MKKILNHMATTMTAALLMLLPLLASCSNDDATNNEQTTSKEKVKVTLKLSASSLNEDATRSAWTRADNDPTTDNGVESEWMKSYIIVIVNSSGNVEEIIQKTLSKASAEETITDVSLTTGPKTIYSFANISLDKIGSITKGSAMPDLSTFATQGNFTTIPDAGIPMSNKQSGITITGNEQTVNLWTVRMYAKIELQITNDTNDGVTINSVSLSDVTANGQNINLLPDKEYNDANSSTACAVNISGTPTTTTFTPSPSSATIASNGTGTITFYVNESKTPTNNHGLFILTLNTTTGSGESSTTTAKYALISNDKSQWNFIARNDYRIIPVRWTDYKFELEIEQYEAIGVLPYWENENDMFTCTFYNPGHFHIIPVITKISTGAKLSYDDSATPKTPTWKLNEYSSSITGYTNTTPSIYASTTDTNHNDAKGKMLLYLGTPLWSGYEHFVYGHFNYETGKAYCELSVIVNDGSATAHRTYNYQLCIVRAELGDDATIAESTRSLPSARSFGYGKFIKPER